MGWTTKLNWRLQDFWTINSKTTRDNGGVPVEATVPKTCWSSQKKAENRGGGWSSVGVLFIYIYIFPKKVLFLVRCHSVLCPSPILFMKHGIFWKLSENESGSWPLLAYSALEISKHCRGKGDSVMLVGFVLFSSLLLLNMPPLAIHLPPQH